MLAEHLKRIADGPEVGLAAEETIGRLALDRIDAENLRDYGHTRLEGLRSLALALAAPEDQTELYRTLAAYWLELRFEWQRNNEVLNYRQAHGRPVDPLVIGQLSVGSEVLACLERSLHHRHLEALAGYAVGLLALARCTPPTGLCDRDQDTASAELPEAHPLSYCLRALAGSVPVQADVDALGSELDLGQAAREQVMAYLRRKYQDLFNLGGTLTALDEEPELHRALAALWLELRFEWQRYNMVLNYQLIVGDPNDPVLLACAAHCSGVLARIETLLLAEHLERMTGFAVDLISGSDEDLRRHFGDVRIPDAVNCAS